MTFLKSPDSLTHSAYWVKLVVVEEILLKSWMPEWYTLFSEVEFGI
jgi:hypothetical protein